MKKALILSKYLPPFPAVGGYRVDGWRKYFHLGGFHPVIVTYNWSKYPTNSNEYRQLLSSGTEIEESPEATIIRVPLSPNKRDKLIFGDQKASTFYRKCQSFLQSVLNTFSLRRHEHRNLYQAAAEYLALNKADVVMATGEPFSLFKLAGKLSETFHLPWVADYRDGWSTNSDVRFLKGLSKWYVEGPVRFAEKRMVESSGLITVVSEPREKEMMSLFPHHKTAVIPNGFDEEAMADLQETSDPNKKFTMAYAGVIYPFQRLDIFLEGMKNFLLAHENAQFQVLFYGLNEHGKTVLLNLEPKWKSFIEIKNALPQKEVWKALKLADALLLLAGKEVDGYCTKSYEYLALQKRILLCINDGGTLESLMKETQAGYLCNNAEEVAQSLERMYNEFQNTGKVTQKTVNYEKFGKSKLAVKYCDILKDLC